MRSPGTRRSIAGVAAFLLLLGATPAAVADTFVGPACEPDHGAPGDIVRLDHFPYPAGCPSLRVFVSTVDAIATPTDDRLIELAGRVTQEPQCIQSVCVEGSTVALPVFTMVVPALTPGSYFVYFACGSAFAQGAGNAGPVEFTVEALPPGASAPPPGALPPDTSTADPDTAPDGPAIGPWAILLGLAAIVGVRRAGARGGDRARATQRGRGPSARGPEGV